MSSPISWNVRQDSKPSATVCTLSMIIIGVLMIFAGGLMTYIYFTEITPPNYDAYYQRYVGSSFPRIVGILILMAGLTLFWGASIFLVYTNWQRNDRPPGAIDQRMYYVENDTRFQSMTPRAREPMGRYYADENPRAATPTKESFGPD